MLISYLRTSLRVFRKNKFFSFLNITSLSLGLFPCIILLLFLQYEYSFDNFHENSESIYRIAIDAHSQRGPFKSIKTSPKLAEAIKTEFSDAGEVLRLYRGESALMRHEDRFFKESDFLFADNILFSFFNVELEKGNPESALDKPHSIVITSEFAQKYIGDEDPIGKLINVEIWINGGSAYSFDDKKLNPSGMDPAGEYMVTGIS